MARPIRREVALVSAVTALSCNGPQNRAPQNTAPVSSAVVVPAAGPSTGQPEETDLVQDPPSGATPSRLDGLRHDVAWTRFKELWRKIDAVEPKQGSYGHTIDANGARAFSETSDELLRGLEKTQLLTSVEANFFRQVVSLRIQNMDHGFQHLMMMHRMPPPYLMDRAASVDRLERKIDALTDLRDEGKIGSREFQSAMALVQREAITLYVLSALGQHYGFPSVAAADGESMLMSLQRKLDETKQDGGAPDERTARIVDEARVLVPAIRELLAELEQ